MRVPVWVRVFSAKVRGNVHYVLCATAELYTPHAVPPHLETKPRNNIWVYLLKFLSRTCTFYWKINLGVYLFRYLQNQLNQALLNWPRTVKFPNFREENEWLSPFNLVVVVDFSRWQRSMLNVQIQFLNAISPESKAGRWSACWLRIRRYQQEF